MSNRIRRCGSCNKYYCVACDKVLTDDIGCDNWQRKEPNVDISPQRLDEVVQDIKFIQEYVDKLS